LRRVLFAEEFLFLVSHLHHVTAQLKDAELVGEFLQCLRILQYTEAEGEGGGAGGVEVLHERVAQGMAFLLSEEEKNGATGKWTSKRQGAMRDMDGRQGKGGKGGMSQGQGQDKEQRQNPSFYKQFHASYCGAAGLSECSFAENGDSLNPPLPRLLHHLCSYEQAED
jgi:hypothetical protein